MSGVPGDWSGMGWGSWSDPDLVRARLAAGADPDQEVPYQGWPLWIAAERGSAEVVAELAARVADVDRIVEGRTALWVAVHGRRPDSARALVAAGADPWRPMMNGWSPARLSLAGPTPDLFDQPPGTPGLTADEVAMVAEAARLVPVLDDVEYDGLSLCCVAGLDAPEVIRRLDATVLHPTDPDALAEEMEEEYAIEQEFGGDIMRVVGVTNVPGGCVVAQPWGYGAQTPVLTRLLSVGTVCHAMYANPKSGNQGSAARDGEMVAWDTHPGGGWSNPDDPTADILRTFLYQGHALAYNCAYAGLEPTDTRSFTGPFDHWLRLPQRDWWKVTDRAR